MICFTIHNLKQEFIEITNKIVEESATASRFKFDFDNLFQNTLTLAKKKGKIDPILSPGAAKGTPLRKSKLVHSSSMLDSMIEQYNKSPTTLVNMGIQSDSVICTRPLLDAKKSCESLKIIASSRLPPFHHQFGRPHLQESAHMHDHQNIMVEEAVGGSQTDLMRSSSNNDSDTLLSAKISQQSSPRQSIGRKWVINRVNSIPIQIFTDTRTDDKFLFADSVKFQSKNELDLLNLGLEGIIPEETEEEGGLFEPQVSLSKKFCPTESSNNDAINSPDSISVRKLKPRASDKQSSKQVSGQSQLSPLTNDAHKSGDDSALKSQTEMPSLKDLDGEPGGQPVTTKKEVYKSKLIKLKTVVYNAPDDDLKEPAKNEPANIRDVLDLKDIKKCRELFTKVEK